MSALLDKPIRKLERYKPHQKYYVDGVEVPGASKISKLGTNTVGLEIWKDNCRRQGIDPEQVRDDAATVGSIVHFLIHAEIEGFETDLSDYAVEEIAKAAAPVGRALEWWENQDLTFVSAEQQMISKLYRYGGTLDMICRNGKGKLVLLDWKTSNAIRPEHRYQIASYEQLAREILEEEIAQRGCIRLSRDGRKVQRNPWIADEDALAHWQVFKAQLALYHALQEAAE